MRKVLITHTVVSDTLHAEPLNSIHSKEVAGYLDEIKKKVIAGDKGEDIILRNGAPTISLHGDRTHTYIPWRCWLDWRENRHRYVRRLGCTPWSTDCRRPSLLCRVEQTLSADNTVKDFIWHLFYIPLDLEFQLGRDNAVCTRIHRMLKLGHWSIDDDGEELGDDDDWELGRSGPRWRRWNSMHALNYLNLVFFKALHEFYSLQCRRVRNSAGVARFFFGPLVPDTWAGERWRRRRESVPGVGPLAT